MQEIFILRHAQAEELNKVQLNGDFERVLTEEGIERTKKLSILFDKLQENPDIVLSSPYVRAKTTADFFVSSLNPRPEIKVVDFLSAGTSCKDIAKGLLPFSSYNKIVLVGHAPDLETFLAKLIGADKIKLKKGTIAKVGLNNSIELSGELEWLITSKIVKKLKVKSKTKVEQNKKLSF